MIKGDFKPILETIIGLGKDEGRWTNSLGMVFVKIPGIAGKFAIGDTRNRDYGIYAEANSGVDKAWQQPSSFEKGPESSVVNVLWNDAVAFCGWLSHKEGRQYRLPTAEEFTVARELQNEYSLRNLWRQEWCEEWNKYANAQEKDTFWCAEWDYRYPHDLTDDDSDFYARESAAPSDRSEK